MIENTEETRVSERKVYVRPELVRVGAVADVTKGAPVQTGAPETGNAQFPGGSCIPATTSCSN